VTHAVRRLASRNDGCVGCWGQPRATQRYQREPNNDEAALTQAIVELASQYGRHGYRQVTGLLRNDGWHVNFHRATIVLPQPASEFLSKAVGGPIPYFQWVE
jgi:hypothetical protein